MEWAHRTRQQEGVVSRRQLHAAGLADHDIRRLVRRRDLTPLLPRVFVDHTGEPTWRQRAWAAVLYAAPAALWGPSALRAVRPTTDARATETVTVAVDASRRVRPVPGVVVRRVRSLDPMVLWNASPPRTRTEESLLDAAATARDEVAAVGVLTDAVQARLTTAGRLTTALDARTRITRRSLLRDVVADLATGTDSVLEHRYLVGVERAHALPRGTRQASLPGLTARHDVVYEEACVVVELDGRLHHSVARDRFADLERDTASLIAGHVTVRLGWSQVVGHPCETATRVAHLLSARGWTGRRRACPACP